MQAHRTGTGDSFMHAALTSQDLETQTAVRMHAYVIVNLT